MTDSGGPRTFPGRWLFVASRGFIGEGANGRLGRVHLAQPAHSHGRRLGAAERFGQERGVAT